MLVCKTLRLAAYPLDLINASIVGMRGALQGLASHGRSPPHLTLGFDELQKVVGFHEYYEESARYSQPIREDTASKD